MHNNGCSCSGDIEMILGERRKIPLVVYLSDRKTFTITSASYLLQNKKTGETEATGTCTTFSDNDESIVWNVVCEIQPEQLGVFDLTYTYYVGTEVLKERVTVRVV